MKFKRNLLSVALASATLMVISPAFAQDTQSTTDAAKKEATKNVGTVKVKGIRKAIEAAIDTKQTNTSIVEAISAEDIGKLPDASIADSIARLPGLTAQRQGGRAQQINIRGFAGDFGATTLNGREQATTSDNRGVEFDQYPSELLGSVVVYKTPDAKLVGQGLSGTVDLRTIRPLNFRERVINIGARAEQNKIRGMKENGFRYNISYIDQFLDNTIGVAVGFAHMDSPQPGYQNEPWGYTAFIHGDSSKQIIGGSKFYKFDANNKRDGLMATVQFKPNDSFESTLDYMTSRMQRTEIKSGAQFWTEWGPDSTPLPGWTSTGNTVTDSKWKNVYPVISMDSNPVDNNLDSLGLNNRLKINSHWTLNTDFSISKAKSNFRNVETTAGIKGRTTDVHISLDPSGMFYNYKFGADLSDPTALVIRGVAAWGGGQDGYYKNFTVVDRVSSQRVNLIRSFDEGFISSIDFGINLTQRNKNKTDYEATLCIVACQGGMDELPFTGSVIDFGVGGIQKLAVYNADQLVANGTWHLVDSPLDWFYGKGWTIEEDVNTAYFQANIDTDLAGRALRGNIGVQYVDTKQSSTGLTKLTNQGVVTVGGVSNYGDSYREILPSLNLGWELMPETQLRFAAAKQMMRPPMSNMSAGFDIGICDTCGPKPIFSGSGGNSALRPWMANAYDLSLEKYFSTAAGNRGYFGLAYFYKDLTSYIWNQTVPFDFAGLPLPPRNPGQTNYPTTTVGQISQPTNGKNGSIKGMEASLSLPLDLLWSPLNGFGIIASYSDTSSSVMNEGPNSSSPLPGLSKYVSNVTAYYERAGFGIRFNRRTRSAFLGSVRAYDGVLSNELMKGEVVKDVQLNYNFRGALDGLSLYFQVSNIGDEPSASYDSNGPIKYFEYGRTTLAGFSYKF